MAELEKSNEASAQVTATQVETTNVHGDKLVSTTTTNYEQQVFSSKSDWRIRAISATNIYLRLRHTYVNNNDVSETLPTFVMSKNLLSTFAKVADLRTRIVAYLYGNVAPDNSRVVEIRALALIPQRASQRSVELPAELPKHEVLDEMKLVGIIHVSVIVLFMLHTRVPEVC